MIYSFNTMSHPVVDATLSRFPDVHVLKTRGVAGVLVYAFYALKYSLLDRDAEFNFQFASYRYLIAAGVIKCMRKNYSVSLWGSDYLKVKGFRRSILKLLILGSAKTSIGTLDAATDLSNEFRIHDKLVVVPYFIENVDFFSSLFIDQKDAAPIEVSVCDVPLTVLCGTNGSDNQQFGVIISAIKLLSEMSPLGKYIFVFHLSYGAGQDTESYICSELDKIGAVYVIEKRYFVGHELYDFRNGIDVLIQIQKTDQLSAAMLEHICLGKVVITGSWLPYKELLGLGLVVKLVDSNHEEEQIARFLSDKCFLSDEDKKNNQTILLENYGSDASEKRWSAFFNGKMMN